jgi:protein AroM
VAQSGVATRLHRSPIFATASPYAATPDAAIDAEELQARGADAILLDCIGFTQRHREALLLLATPIILSNAVVVKALSQLPGG